ncbi:MAG: hypothetical protein IJY30_05485 [Muribaculaceae bacterium]|nr:hypothetical protein [Muribaculaceae bacterium]
MLKNLFKSLIFFVMCIVGMTASAADFSVNGLYYNKIDTENVLVTSGTIIYSGDISIPETVEY